MRLSAARFRMTCCCLVLVPSIAGAQQFTPLQNSDTLIAPRMAGMTVEQPQPLPAAAALQAKPLAPLLEPPPVASRSTVRRNQPPVNFRLVSAEEPVKAPAAKKSLRLAPRGEPARVSTPVGNALRGVPSAVRNAAEGAPYRETD